jgi:rSAM/selenodomain-associated transferase 1
MSYRVLDPSQHDPSLAHKCAFAVMAKAPRPGKVKTRLAPPLTLDESAALNVCFLKDTTQNLAEVSRSCSADGLVCYTPVGDESFFDGILPDTFTLIAQRGDGFGERLFAATQDILACGYGSVCLIDSDSPTVPAAAFKQAIEELMRAGDRIVLGGSDDGGYYLIGMKRAHPEPFTEINWSSATVYSESVFAIHSASIELVELPTWYDIDDGATLEVLADELLRNTPPPFATISGYTAPRTKEFLERRAREIA